MTEQGKFKHHPISIQDVRVKELFIKGNVHPDSVDENQEIKYSIKVGHSEYDQDKAQIVVVLSLETEEVEEKESEQPYSIKIELVGLFKIDEDRFHREHIYDWARRNAAFILFPYLREHAYSLSIRCGYKPFILPLVEVPTFRPIATDVPTQSDH